MAWKVPKQQHGKGETKGEAKLLDTFLRNEKSVSREGQSTEPAELKRYLTDLFRSVKSKDGDD